MHHFIIILFIFNNKNLVVNIDYIRMKSFSLPLYYFVPISNSHNRTGIWHSHRSTLHVKATNNKCCETISFEDCPNSSREQNESSLSKGAKSWRGLRPLGAPDWRPLPFLKRRALQYFIRCQNIFSGASASFIFFSEPVHDSVYFARRRCWF